MTGGSPRGVLAATLFAIIAANSGCAVYFGGGVHSHWVPTDSAARRGSCARLPKVYELDAPTEPYRSIGIIQVLSIATGIVLGQFIKPDREEIFAALRKDACELGCDVLVERRLHHVAARFGEPSDVPWMLAQFPGFNPPGTVTAPLSIPTYHPPPMYDTAPPPEVDELQFVCGVSVAESRDRQPAQAL